MRTPDIENKSIISSRNKLLWLLLIVFGSVTYLAGSYFPPTLQSQNKVITQCPTVIEKQLGFTCGEFDSETNPILAMEADNITPENIFLKLEAFPTFKGNKPRNADVTLKIEYSVYEIVGDKVPFATFFNYENKITFTCTDQNDISCSPETIAETSIGSGDRYIFIIKLLNSKDMLNNQVEDLELAFVSISPAFEIYLTYFKWILLAVAIAGFVIYRTTLLRMPKGYTSLEQFYVSVMGLMLLFFAQPFTSHSDHSDSTSKSLYSFLSVFIRCGVVAFLSLFWFNLLERLASVTFVVSTPSKFAVHAYSFALFSASLATYGFLDSHQDQDYTTFLDFYSISSEEFDVTVSKYFLYAVLVLGGAWSLLRISQIIPKFKELDWRDSTSFTFTFCYVLCYAFFLSTGSLQPINFKGARVFLLSVVFLYGITTLYTLLLQVIYAPFEHEIEEAEKRKKYDNPEAKGQYGDLDGSDFTSPAGKHDGINLSNADELKKGKNKDIDVSES